MGTGASALVLTLGAVVTAYAVFCAYAIEPAGPWDHHAVTNATMSAGLGLLFAALLTLLTWVATTAEWLRTWWYAIPLTLAAAAVVRLTLAAPTP